MGIITKTLLNIKLENLKAKTGRNYYQLEYANGAVSLVKKGEFGGIDRLSPPVNKGKWRTFLILFTMSTTVLDFFPTPP